MKLLARLVSHHPWKVLLLWLLVFLLCGPLAARTPGALKTQDLATLGDTESSRVIDTLKRDFGEKLSSNVLLVSQSTPPLTSAPGKATYDAYTAGLKDVPGVSRIFKATSSPSFPTQSADGGRALTIAEIPSGAEGKATLERLRTKPLVQENLSRAEKVYNDAVDLTEDALGVVSAQTRLVGDRAAKLAGRVSEEVEDVAVGHHVVLAFDP